MKPKILIIEDDPVTVKIYLKAFKDNFDTKVAYSGEEGINSLGQFVPDIILLDLLMPGMDGYETCRQIKRSEDFKKIPVLIVSSRAIVEERLKGYESGAEDFITKPFDERELLAKIKVFLRLNQKSA